MFVHVSLPSHISAGEGAVTLVPTPPFVITTRAYTVLYTTLLYAPADLVSRMPPYATRSTGPPPFGTQPDPGGARSEAHVHSQDPRTVEADHQNAFVYQLSLIHI